MKTLVLVVAVLPTLLCGQAAGASALITQIGASDLIVIGETSNAGSVANGVLTLGLSVSATLKGPAPAGDLTAHFTLGASGPQAAISGAAGRCGIFFLASAPGGWFLLPRRQPQFSLDDLYYAEGSCGAVVAPPAGTTPDTDVVVSAVIEAVESGTPSDQYIVALFRSLNATDSPAVALAATQMSSAGQPGLKVLSLGWRLALDQDEALTEVPAWIQTLGQSTLGGILVSAISGYSGTSAAAMGGLGQIAIQGSGTGFDVAASFALRGAHTSGALPYLLGLLDSANARVRLNAVAGLSMSLAGVPPVASGESPQAVLERAMNPAFRKQLSADDQAHLQFASLGDAASEAALIAWWKTRAQQMIAAGQ